MTENMDIFFLHLFFFNVINVSGVILGVNCNLRISACFLFIINGSYFSKCFSLGQTAPYQSVCFFAAKQFLQRHDL